jgi:hypothetical protein
VDGVKLASHSAIREEEAYRPIMVGDIPETLSEFATRF